jgi:CelD/BcsL family acetyltransferase involved in cellulose biosynthesis
MDVTRVLSTSAETVLPFLRSLVPGLRREAGTDVIADLGGVRTAAYRAWPEDGPLVPAWEDLHRRTPGSTVFQTPHWQRALLVWPQRLGHLRLLAVWRADKLLGVLPMQERRGKRLESAGAIVSDYLDPLVDPAEKEAFWRSILGFLRRQIPDGAAVTLRNIRPHAECRTTLKGMAADEGFTLEEAERGYSCFLDLPASWDEYLDRLRSHDRKELRRKVNKAESQGQAKLVAANDPEQARAAIAKVFSFIEAGGGERGLKCRWLFRGLLAASADSLARQDWLRTFSLRLGERTAAGVIAFRGQNEWMTWATGYDPAEKTFSPGIVTFGMTIRRAIEEKLTRLDLLRGESDYKMRLGAQLRPLYQLTLKARG